jgi:hypothetical protein
VPKVQEVPASDLHHIVGGTAAPLAPGIGSSYSLLRCGLLYGLSLGKAGTVPPMRRNVFDPLEPTKEPRWYVVRNMHRTVIEARALPIGCDLKRALVAAMLEYINGGWRLGEFSSRTGFFFCDKAGERRMVEISPSDPGPPS